MTLLRLGPRPKRNAMPRAPAAIADAVELWARKQGRNSNIHYVPYGGWFVDLTLKPDDPRMKLFRDGKAEQPPTERVWFHVPNPKAGQRALDGSMEPEFLPIDILQLGAEGCVKHLEKGNTFSGRGEFDSLDEALEYAREKNKEMKRKNRAHHREENRLEQRHKRRWRFGIPVIQAGIDLAKSAIGSDSSDS